jgi:predicted permease
MTAALTLPEHKYADPQSRQQFFDELLERVAQLPGVAASGLVNVLPFSTYDRGSRIVIDGEPTPDPGREPAIAFRVATPGYYDAMGIPLAAGRVFDRRDTRDGQRVAIINRRAVEQHFGGQLPLGRRMRLGGAGEPWLTIVGVVGDVLHSSLTRAPQAEVYVPMSQSTAATMMLAVRTTARPESLSSSMRAVVREIDPQQPIYHVKTLETLVGDALLPSRTSASMVTMFSGLALILAAIGIYGVVAYGVSQQAREFGVRMALGATPRDVVQLVLRHGLMMIASGVAIGIAGAWAVSGALRGVLHGVSSTDPGTYVAAAVALTLSGVAACAVPAWRASATKPVSALRAE